MRIVILGSVALPVPPPMQGGTERVAYLQAKGLAQKGHDVTLVAAVGSEKNSLYRLVAIGGGDTVEGSKQSGEKHNQEFVESSRKLRKESVYLARVGNWLLENASSYDVILNNMRAGESFFLPLAKKVKKPIVDVMHLPIFTDLANIFSEYRTPIITISNAQRHGFPDLRYIGTVYNGIQVSDFPFSQEAGSYLLMVGSVAPHKNQKAGIEVAKRVGKKLIMAGKVGNKEYYEKEIAPHIDGNTIIHLGEIGFEEKVKLYEEAYALLFPVLWEEPFGLVMIEAMACGTPVIAFNRGSVPEVVADGVTGFIVNTTDEMVAIMPRISTLDRNTCRKHVQDHFSSKGMVESLEHALISLLEEGLYE